MISMMVKNHSSVPNVKVHLMELNPLTLMKEHTRGSNVLIEIQGKHQKILICTAYREFSYIVTPRQMSGTIHVPIQGPLRTLKKTFFKCQNEA